VKKWARYETVSLAERGAYFEVSCRPITKRAEDDMELLSDLVTWGERFTDHWQLGVYQCARCRRPLYSSRDKYSGPCRWPSWRRPLDGGVSTADVRGYGDYVCAVRELYCADCDLFLGHMFHDASLRGQPAWRH